MSVIPFNESCAPVGSPSTRRCTDCGKHDPVDGSRGPPVDGLVGYLGGTRSELLSGRWFCAWCSELRWVTWNEPARLAARKRWVWAEVARRKAILDALEPKLPLQLPLRWAG